MCLTILQICNLWFSLQSKHKVYAFFLSFWVPANELEAVQHSAQMNDPLLCKGVQKGVRGSPDFSYK